MFGLDDSSDYIAAFALAVAAASFALNIVSWRQARPQLIVRIVSRILVYEGGEEIGGDRPKASLRIANYGGMATQIGPVLFWIYPNRFCRFLWRPRFVGYLPDFDQLPRHMNFRPLAANSELSRVVAIPEDYEDQARKGLLVLGCQTTHRQRLYRRRLSGWKRESAMVPKVQDGEPLHG